MSEVIEGRVANGAVTWGGTAWNAKLPSLGFVLYFHGVQIRTSSFQSFQSSTHVSQSRISGVRLIFNGVHALCEPSFLFLLLLLHEFALLLK